MGTFSRLRYVIAANVNALLDMFLEIGYDAYQSIQPTADMDICRIKRKRPAPRAARTCWPTC